MDSNDIIWKHKASHSKRFVNYLIDYVFAFSVSLVFFILLGFVLTSIGQSDALIFLVDNKIVDQILTALIVNIVLFCVELLSKGRSIGKYITGTQVVSLDEQPLDAKKFFTRNICRLIPFDPLSFLGEHGWHDKFSKTLVVDKKAYEEELMLQNDIDDIGLEDRLSIEDKPTN